MFDINGENGMEKKGKCVKKFFFALLDDCVGMLEMCIRIHVPPVEFHLFMWNVQ